MSVMVKPPGGSQGSSLGNLTSMYSAYNDAGSLFGGGGSGSGGGGSAMSLGSPGTDPTGAGGQLGLGGQDMTNQLQDPTKMLNDGFQGSLDAMNRKIGKSPTVNAPEGKSGINLSAIISSIIEAL